MPRFILLYHNCPPDFAKPSHWDLMLEADGVLQTWELRELPGPWERMLGNAINSDHRSVPATRLADHRLEYLTYEGPLSNNRGSVTRIAAGTFQEIDANSDGLTVQLQAGPITGTLTLNRAANGDQWHATVD